MSVQQQIIAQRQQTVATEQARLRRAQAALNPIDAEVAIAKEVKDLCLSDA